MIWILSVFAALLLAAIAFWITMQRGTMAIFRWNKRPRAGQIRVACVGDSITYGYGVQNWAKMQYPKQLGRMLGDKYCVQNFGVCGATASSAGDCPFEKTAAYRESLDFAPDLVLLMLGTNDSKPYNWKEQEHFKKDLKTLIESFRALPAKPEIWLCLPVPAYGHAWSINDSIIYNGVIPYIKEVAREENIPLVDLNTPMQGKRQYFPDTIHPNAAGYTQMEKVIAPILKKVLEENAKK